MAFWPHAYAAMEFLEALGYEWTDELGFDCHESYLVRWSVPESMAGYLAWLARHGRSVARLPEEFPYRDPWRSGLAVVKSLTDALERHVNRPD